MQAFNEFTAIAAPLPIANIDTDKILAGQFLKTTTRDGLGEKLFWSLRQDENFILNVEPWCGAGILIGLENFGCGSSREHAPWALLDFGIRCIIAPSIADIFSNNCFKNGILPIELPLIEVLELINLVSDPLRSQLTVNLCKRRIITESGEQIGFKVDERQRSNLLNGFDDILLSLAYGDEIKRFEGLYDRRFDWLGSTNDVVSDI